MLLLEDLLILLQKQDDKLVLKCLSTTFTAGYQDMKVIAAAVTNPEVNERGSSLIRRRTYFSSKRKNLWSRRKELWLCANGGIRLRSLILVPRVFVPSKCVSKLLVTQKIGAEACSRVT